MTILPNVVVGYIKIYVFRKEIDQDEDKIALNLSEN